MTKIYVARHGENEDNAAHRLNGRRDLPLTEKGRDQARILARGIMDLNIRFDVMYTSPLARAMETTTIVAGEMGYAAKPVVLQDLIERNFGILSGEPIADIEKLVPSEKLMKTRYVTYFLEAEGAENFDQVLERARSVVEHIRTHHVGQTVGVFTHGDVGKFMYFAFYGLPWREYMGNIHLGNGELLLLDEGISHEESHIVKIPQHYF